MPGLVFMGSKMLGLRALDQLSASCGDALRGIITPDDSADTRSVLPEIKSRAAALRLPLQVVSRPSGQKAAIMALAPEAVIVCGWYWLLPPELLALAPGGFAGCHASLLPAYRGNAPLVWAMLRGEQHTGVTLFYFDEGMDTGDIVAQRGFSLSPGDTIADALQQTEAAILALLSEHAAAILAGTAPRRPQNHAQASYGSLRRPQDGVIDWRQPASRVHDFVRAQTRPYPGAFTSLPDGTPLHIWGTRIFPQPFYGVPGLVCQREENGTVVSCGDGAVIVTECSVREAASVPPHSLLKWGQQLGAA